MRLKMGKMQSRNQKRWTREREKLLHFSLSKYLRRCEQRETSRSWLFSYCFVCLFCCTTKGARTTTKIVVDRRITKLNCRLKNYRTQNVFCSLKRPKLWQELQLARTTINSMAHDLWIFSHFVYDFFLSLEMRNNCSHLNKKKTRMIKCLNSLISRRDYNRFRMNTKTSLGTFSINLKLMIF